jgi:hypothetical protein
MKKIKPKLEEIQISSPEQLAAVLDRRLPHYGAGAKVGLTDGAVDRIRRGDRWPRSVTFFRLVELAGYNLVLKQRKRV